MAEVLPPSDPFDLASEPADGAVRDARTASVKVPPHSIEAEQAVLGGLLLHAAGYWEISDVITEVDFYRGDHRLIWNSILTVST